MNGKWNVNASDLKKIKIGAVLPDKVESLLGSKNPYLHGRDNYIANTKAVTRLAQKGEKNCSVRSISSNSYEVGDANKVINALKNMTKGDWKQAGVSGGIPCAEDKKLYFYGVAIHIATDAVAHKSFGYRNGRYYQINPSDGCDNKGVVQERWDYAVHLAYRIIRAYYGGNQSSYKTFVPDASSLYNTMIKNVTFQLECIYGYALNIDGEMWKDEGSSNFLKAYTYMYGCK